MREHVDSIISDNDFADIYCLNNGRPSVPPARMAKVLILQHYEGLSDRQALEMLRFNIKWKYALNVPLNYEGFDDSLLTHFRARLLTNNKEKVVFKKTLELAKEAKEGIGRSLAFYNQERRHQSLDYRTPTEVYFNMRNQKTTSIGILKYNQLVFDQ